MAVSVRLGNKDGEIVTQRLQGHTFFAVFQRDNKSMG